MSRLEPGTYYIKVEGAKDDTAGAYTLKSSETAATARALQDSGFGRPVLWTTFYEELEAAVVESVRTGDTVLLKGSRGVALDRLVAPLRAA